MMQNIDPQKLKGLRYATIGFLFALIGVLFFVFNLEVLGRLLIYFGFTLTFLGIGVHFYILFKR